MNRPRLLYDDECGICTRSARFVARRAEVTLVPFSAVDADLAAALPEEWRTCAHLLTDAGVYSCGEAMMRAYELTGHPPARLLPYLRRLPGWPWLRETAYRAIAANRDILGRVF